ncbi:PREDICTED: thiosulfate sulfurtransferase-like [Cyprinodon variegatus]|uniref:Sulfurtransferase n=1 Tax=Cyprinodon variegatus TaxID=28743 RepID=A0A3Q2CC19_CYPVA|nr:PREDICTED: thiosulfate sulfurtransferase-like [Cyprinodon variegatus]
MAAQLRAVVSSRWLANAVKTNLIGPKLCVLDGSYFPVGKRNPRTEFNQKHIPGASFFDLDECCDKRFRSWNMLPTSSDFSRYVGDLGIGNDTHVIVYDTSDMGSFSAPRVWWMFRVFGHGSVSVLDGGLKNWLAEGHPVTSDCSKPERRDFQAELNQSWVKSFEDVMENIKTKKVQVVDSRPAGRFQGTEPEAREGVLPGHFPGAISIPFKSFLDSSGKYHSTDTLAKLFKEAGVDVEKPLWASCSLGITACHVILAAHRLGLSDVALYDGSWTEFFQRAPPEYIISEGAGKKV